MSSLLRTPLYERHLSLKAQMVAFGGWQMPVNYPDGILKEHLATRREAGLFDVSHMGRFAISGQEALPFLQQVLSNNAAALEVAQSQYTIIPDDNGFAVDDAYLYRFFDDQFLLVVNAANRQKDWEHLQTARASYPSVVMEDHTETIAMISLQGPASKRILSEAVDRGGLPEPQRNALSAARMGSADLWIGRTGYTGEPLCFEIFVQRNFAEPLWDRLMAGGAQPVGLGARDTLRLEAGLPLYGHELGNDPTGAAIPIFSMPLARVAVSFSPLKGGFTGQVPLKRQFAALKQFMDGNFDRLEDLPSTIRPFEVIDKGIARAGAPVFNGSEQVGWVTSGTMVPLWRFDGEGLGSTISDQSDRRAIGLALMDSRIEAGDTVQIEVRGKQLQAGVMPCLLRSEAPPHAHAFTWPVYQQTLADKPKAPKAQAAAAHRWVTHAIENHLWRSRRCINLIPSEQTPSALVRLVSVTDPVGRYAEHKTVKAFADTDIFYYQGTEFIAAVEAALVEEMRRFLDCRQVESRPISGQMANMVLFSALVDHINRTDRKSEQRRLRMVMNHHIIKGGHLSAQPMGALRDYVMRDHTTERPAVVNFPMLLDNPYQVDLPACEELIDRYRPELIILGRSMTLHKEPVVPIRKLLDALGLDTVLHYDMAHVLGLCGPFFQEPFAEGADIVTGSTHKTFFGTQRGVVAADIEQNDPRQMPLWEAIERRAFPGAVSNHHLGSLLGLLVAAMEMNAFKAEYQPKVLSNAKAFARALADCGLSVAGDPQIGFTETHQVIVHVGYARGPAVAKRLEENNIICNFQAGPEEEGFTAAGALRLGVSEMTRFGMQAEEFQSVAQLMADVILHGKEVKQAVETLRGRFTDLRFCFEASDFDALMNQLHQLF